MVSARWTQRLVAAVLLVVAIGLGWAGPASAKSFTIDRFEVEATVNPDGSMDLAERLTYTFAGTFNTGERDIPPGDYEIVDMRAFEDGEPLDIIDANPASFRWSLRGVTGVHTYELTYRVLGAVDVYDDVGELYWQFVGTDFPAVGEVDVEITFPDADGLRAWAHGPLNGVVEIAGRVVTLSVDDLDAGQFVEARVVSPSSNFTVSTIGGDRLPTILEDEQRFADDANRDRLFLKVGQIGAPVAGVLGLVGFFFIWRAWGKEPKRPDDIGDYWREIPTDAPAVVQAIDSWGAIGGQSFAATTVDLAQRGWLTITETTNDGVFRDSNDYVFTATGQAPDRLTDFEESVLHRMFTGRGGVTQSELLGEARSNRSEASTWFNQFKGMIKRTYEAQGYQESGRCGLWALQGLLIASVAGIGLLAFVRYRLVLGAVAFVIAGVLLMLSPLLRRRTALGARRKAEVDGLRNFLRDFSRLDEVPIGHMVLYERYLVYAVALGVAGELVAGLRMRVPEVNDPNVGFASWYLVSSHAYSGGGYDGGAGTQLDGLSSIGSFTSDLGSNFSAAFSPPASSSGGGGGFSGGGRGGGGGGGAGAS
ncbi:MAG: DUF2207 family protein [Acidimicrobiales bacterium]